ncbi:MAG: DUF2959 family protein [Sulfurifustaceae bacterium]
MRRSFLLVLIVSLAGAGCASTPVARQKNVEQSLTDVKQELIGTRAQLDKTLVSLTALVNSSADDVKKSYAQYSSDVKALKQQADALQKSREELRVRREKWVNAWQKSYRDIQNPELKRVSEERRSQVVARFDEVSRSYEAAADTFTPLLRDLDDVRMAAGNDLTPRGVAAIAATSAVQNAPIEGAAVEQHLNSAISEFDRLQRALLAPAAG